MSDNEYDLSAVIENGVGDSGVAYGETLLRFVEAVMGDEEDALRHSRQELLEKLGSEELVDSAAVIATFNKMDRIADSTGIPLDGMLDVTTIDIRSEIGLDRFPSAANTSKPGSLKRILSRIVKPIAPFGIKMLLALQRKSESSQSARNGEQGKL